VLPTGISKTETMLATQVYRRLHRSLVLVPSDASRRQIAKKPEKPGDRRDVNRTFLMAIVVIAVAGRAATLLPARRASRFQIASMMREN
jgi:hypothetical protein